MSFIDPIVPDPNWELVSPSIEEEGFDWEEED